MKIEKVFEGIRYTLSNELLLVNDNVYPIARGRCLDNNDWILHNFDFRDFISGFPNEPHVIKDLNYSKYKPEEVRTDKGFSPRESYYKIIKKEKQILESKRKFASRKWIEI